MPGLQACASSSASGGLQAFSAYGTHYVVLAYELQQGYRPTIVLDAQHSESKWMAVSNLIAASDVHESTKAYFHT
jgi:hypothetical protein